MGAVTYHGKGARKGTLAKGICPCCDGEWAVTDVGLMRGHKGDSIENMDPQTGACLGSGETPTKITKAAT